MRLVRFSRAFAIAFASAGMAATISHAGTAPSAAPIPLAGGSLAYLAAAGGAGGLWFAVRALGARLRKRDRDGHK